MLCPLDMHLRGEIYNPYQTFCSGNRRSYPWGCPWLLMLLWHYSRSQTSEWHKEKESVLIKCWWCSGHRLPHILPLWKWQEIKSTKWWALTHEYTSEPGEVNLQEPAGQKGALTLGLLIPEHQRMLASKCNSHHLHQSICDYLKETFKIRPVDYSLIEGGENIIRASPEIPAAPSCASQIAVILSNGTVLGSQEVLGYRGWKVVWMVDIIHSAKRTIHPEVKFFSGLAAFESPTFL